MQIKRGYLSFAGAGPNTRDFQFFIAYKGRYVCMFACVHVCMYALALDDDDGRWLRLQPILLRVD